MATHVDVRPPKSALLVRGVIPVRCDSAALAKGLAAQGGSASVESVAANFVKQSADLADAVAKVIELKLWYVLDDVEPEESSAFPGIWLVKFTAFVTGS